MSPADNLTPAAWARIRGLFDALAELEPAERERLLAAEPDRELAAAVTELYAAEAGAGSLLESQTALGPPEPGDGDELAVGTSLGPWRITGVLGQGGMGTVYRASRADGTFEREVAIKLVRGAVDGASLQRRFEAERRILATLDHPGIAQLLDAGTTSGGMPYLVLELVDGLELDEYCREHQLGLAGRLRLFVEICEAVSFAHEKLVLHRDLKPSNVLVDAAGRPKLLDFGIAKVLDPETGTENAATLTRFGLRALTPAYASPEQLRSEPLTTASDVWALGAVLYHLLCGRLPFPDALGTGEQRATQIEGHPLEPPSSILRRQGSVGSLPWRSVRGDLDTIVAKALAPDRSRRYRSVGELADDLRRLLEGRPVLARPDSWAYRTQRFLRRHALGVAATVLVVTALVGAALVALHQARLARAERDLARSRFDEVRQLAGVFLFEVHDRIALLPGSLATRELLASTAIEYLDRLAAGAEDELDLAAEVAAGYERLATIQGQPFRGHRGDATAARTSLEKALALRERLLAQGYPDAERAATSLAEALLSLAEVESELGQYPRGVELVSRGVKILEAGAHDSVLGARLGVRLGHLLALTGDRERGVVELDRAITILEEGAAAGDPEVRFALARAHADHGSVVGNSGAEDAFERALVAMRRALEVDAELVREHPENLRFLGSLARSWRMLGSTLSVLYRDTEALEAFLHSAELAEKLVAAEPADVEAQARLAAARLDAAGMLAAIGRLDEADPLVDAAIAVLETLHTSEPENVRVAVSLASAIGRKAHVLAYRAETLGAADRDRAMGEACGVLGRSTELYGDLLARGLLNGTEADVARESADRFANHCRG